MTNKFVATIVLASVSSAACAYKVTSQKDVPDFRLNDTISYQILCDNGKSQEVVKKHGMTGAFVYIAKGTSDQEISLDRAAKKICKE